MTLKFTAGNHQYRMDGKPVKGVTTLIKGGMANEGLKYWSAKTVAEYVADNEDAVTQLRAMGRAPMVAALKEVPWQERDEKAARGTEVHALGERVVAGEDVDVPAHLVPFVQGYASWLDRFGVVPVLAEKSCGNREHWYAGRPDLVADIGGVRWMLDLKTASRIYPDVAIQLDAYRNMEFWVTDDDPDAEYPMPEGIERLGALHVTADGTTLYPMESDGHPFRTFLHCAWITRNDKRIKSYLLDPITDPKEL